MNSDLPEVSLPLLVAAVASKRRHQHVLISICFCQVLHPVAELPVLCHVLRAVQGAQHSHISIVVSRQSAAAIQQVWRGFQMWTGF